jgi:hypothetical protein
MSARAQVAAADTISEGLAYLDTRSQSWEPNGFERAFRKVLTIDGDGSPSAFISYLPGDFSSDHDLPSRHLHHRVHEFSFALGGEYPIWQYASAGDQHGVLTVLKPGYFFSRLPGSVHGREPGPITHVGFTSITWRDRAGNWMFEPSFADESAFVGYDEGWHASRGSTDVSAQADGTVLRWPDLTILDTHAMPWRVRGGGVMRKQRWSEPTVELVRVESSTVQQVEDPVENAFVLEGGLEVHGIVVAQAGFLRREMGAPCALRGGPAGATVLTWRDPEADQGLAATAAASAKRRPRRGRIARGRGR